MRKLLLYFIIFIHFIWFFTVLSFFPVVLLYPTSHKFVIIALTIALGSLIPLQECPLTVWQNKLSDGEKYKGTFIRHYLQKFFKVEIPDAWVHFWFTIYYNSIAS